ncbi:MAG: acyltransferase family protein [Thermoleophilia bacterium]
MPVHHLTCYVRGVVILTVMTDHFFGNYVPDYYSYIAAIAYGLLGMFFIISGYGIFFSLEKRFRSGRGTGRVLARFAYDRAIRILPLYWIALLVASYLQPVHGDFWDGYPHIYLIVFGFVLAPSFLWFVTAVIQCYILAPLLFFLVSRVSLNKCLMGGGLMLSATYAASLLWLPDLARLPNDKLIRFSAGFIYHQLFLANIILFFFGMMLPGLIGRYGKYFNAGYILPGLTVLLIGVLYATRFDSVLFNKSGTILVPVYIFSIAAFSLSLFVTAPALPLARFFRVSGVNSYPIYLFHLSFFGLIAAAGLLDNGGFLNLVIFLVFLPSFIMLCQWIETGSAMARDRLDTLFDF